MPDLRIRKTSFPQQVAQHLLDDAGGCAVQRSVQLNANAVLPEPLLNLGDLEMFGLIFEGHEA